MVTDCSASVLLHGIDSVVSCGSHPSNALIEKHFRNCQNAAAVLRTVWRHCSSLSDAAGDSIRHMASQCAQICFVYRDSKGWAGVVFAWIFLSSSDRARKSSCCSQGDRKLGG